MGPLLLESVHGSRVGGTEGDARGRDGVLSFIYLMVWKTLSWTVVKEGYATCDKQRNRDVTLRASTPVCRQGMSGCRKRIESPRDRGFRKKERKGGINQSFRRLVRFCLKSIGCAEVADTGREIRKVFESK